MKKLSKDVPLLGLNREFTTSKSRPTTENGLGIKITLEIVKHKTELLFARKYRSTLTA